MFPFVPAWMRPVQPRFTLQQCGRCGLRHGWTVCNALTSSCFKCGRRGHYARMCKTRNSRTICAVSSVPTRSVATQTDETYTVRTSRKSKRKQTRDRERIIRFRTSRKNRKENSTLNEMPFSSVSVIEIHSETLETQVKKFRDQAASNKSDAQYYQNKWLRERQASLARLLDKEKNIKEFQEKLSAIQKDLEESKKVIDDFQNDTKKKQEEINSLRKYKEFHSSRKAIYSGPPRGARKQYPRTSNTVRSMPDNTSSSWKHEDVFRGAKGYCDRVK
ncbi:transmembrane protein DDB_G0272716-like [Saccostrea cucullata]|uniref:transmembrane protein DDB_G0272716-like n=1 Tax=Saccostrea cuccullata TaxID=36930 RepID=UPI002ED3E011